VDHPCSGWVLVPRVPRDFSINLVQMTPHPHVSHWQLSLGKGTWMDGRGGVYLDSCLVIARGAIIHPMCPAVRVDGCLDLTKLLISRVA